MLRKTIATVAVFLIACLVAAPAQATPVSAGKSSSDQEVTQWHTWKIDGKCYMTVGSNGKTANKVGINCDKNFPQDYVGKGENFTPACGVWYQVDKYTGKQSAIDAVTKDGKLTYSNGKPEDSHIVKDWYFKYGGDCKPQQPKAEKGTDKWTEQICKDSKPGYAVKTSYEQKWTQEYVWNANSNKWELGAKQYGDVKVKDTDLVKDSSCIPAKPDPKSGEKQLPPTQVCKDPADGTATLTTWKKTWTQDWEWNAKKAKWELGEKVYSEPIVVSTKTVKDKTCIPTKPEPTSGTETRTTQICTAPANGTTVVTTYSKSWTQDWTWSHKKGEWVQDDKVWGEETVTNTEVIQDDSCIPQKPRVKHGKIYLPPTQECVESLNGTATKIWWKQTWTQDWVWSSEQGKWVAGEKVYSDPIELHSKTVYDLSCRPEQPSGELGTDYKVTQVCKDPKDGTASKITWKRSWTQDYVWNVEQGEWVLGDPVYTEFTAESSEDVLDDTCIPATLGGEAWVVQCKDDVPFIYYDVDLIDPNGFATDATTATFTFTSASHPGKTYVMENVPLGDGYVLWPGATAVENPDGSFTGTGWPGWYQDSTGKWIEDANVNEGWTRGPLSILVQVNPEMTVTVDGYPAPTSLCYGPETPEEPVELNEELDAPAAAPVTAEAQYAG